MTFRERKLLAVALSLAMLGMELVAIELDRDWICTAGMMSWIYALARWC